jgi:acyl-CoA dehydrogenase
VFAMQCMGAGPVALYGNDSLRKSLLPLISAGKTISGFAISEAEAGSDVTAMTTSARRDGDSFVINGEKTWISNGGIADCYIVFCRFPEAGEKKFIALLVHSDDPGFSVPKRIDLIAPHPIGTLAFHDCRVPADRIVGEPGKGMRVALGTLDVLRSGVGAAALGFARRAFDEACKHVQKRQAFGKSLAEHQLTRGKLADMATAIDTSALLVYRAAWTRDSGNLQVTREAAMAKMHATESAQTVIDTAVQLFGARGIVSEEPVERLYREIRALRIYEGTTEIQKLVIASQVLHE